MQLGQRLQKMLFENQELRAENGKLVGLHENFLRLQAERDALEEKADMQEGELDELQDRLHCTEEQVTSLRAALDTAAR
jgi:predicted nuclease with TOPRIM domain